MILMKSETFHIFFKLLKAFFICVANNDNNSNKEDIRGNIIDVNLVSFSSHLPPGSKNYNEIENKLHNSLDINGQRRDLVFRRGQKPINYPVKDLFPKDEEEESGSGSGDGMLISIYTSVIP